MIRRVLPLFAVLAVIGTWPQAIRWSSVPDNVDAYFSLWRLGWIAHQLPAAPLRLFHGNIFYPEPYTLAYSDAVLLEGAVGTPFIRAGVPVVYVYNALVLGSFVACALGMFVLTRRLTGAAMPAFLAGVVFAFAPYRFDHYFHLELLWAMWMPLALCAVHRTIESGRVRDGLAAGALVALQVLSSIYYGVFLSTALLVFVVPLLAGAAPRQRRRALIALAAGGVLAAAVAIPYASPYQRARDALGERSAGEALLHGAGPLHYLAAMPENRLTGRLTGRLGRHEKRLFPGFVALALVVVALWPPLARTTVAYALVLIVAIDLSFGPRGPGYDWLREHVVVYRGLRAPARFGQLSLLAFAVLAAVGCARLQGWLAGRVRRPALVIAGLVVLSFCEYLVRPLQLVDVPIAAPAAYQWLRMHPRAVLAELPMPVKATLPLHEGQFAFRSTFHWHPLVNGYSGSWSERYVRLIERAGRFPDEQSIRALEEAGATHAFVHERFFGRARYAQALEQLRGRTDIEESGRFDDEGFETRAYRLTRRPYSTPGMPGGSRTWAGGSGTQPPGRR